MDVDFLGTLAHLFLQRFKYTWDEKTPFCKNTYLKSDEELIGNLLLFQNYFLATENQVGI